MVSASFTGLSSSPLSEFGKEQRGSYRLSASFNYPVLFLLSYLNPQHLGTLERELAGRPPLTPTAPEGESFPS